MGYRHVLNPGIRQVIAEIITTVQVADKNFVQVRARDFQSYKNLFVAYFSNKCTWQISALR